jgi:signal transduction histidine kinase
MAEQLEAQAVLDALGHGVLIFTNDGKLIQHNRMAGTLLGQDLKLIQKEGWRSAAALFDTDLDIANRIDEVRKRALQSDRAVRFHIFRGGEYVPCWATVVTGKDGEVLTMLTLDVADWEVIGEVLAKFRMEMRDAVDSTRGHIDLINRTMKTDDTDSASAKLNRRIGGFTRLIAIHMSRAKRLMTMLERLEDIRTGKVREVIKAERKKLNFVDFMEEFMESLDETELLDPETDVQDYRARIQYKSPDTVYVNVARRYLTYALQELVRNAIMYSLKAAPVKITITPKASVGVQVDVVDEGYGIRQKFEERVFVPFQRAQQPQIISEFGYGLSLYLCKQEIEAMGGRIWFTATDGVGTTFHMMLPLWRDEPVSSSSSSSEKAE